MVGTGRRFIRIPLVPYMGKTHPTIIQPSLAAADRFQYPTIHPPCGRPAAALLPSINPSTFPFPRFLTTPGLTSARNGL